MMKKIEGYPEYWITDSGQVWSEKADAYLSLKIDKNGYYYVDLYNEDGCKTKRIHRLVAETFIPNIENKTTVDHINRDRTDNRVENLRWATIEEQNENRDKEKVLIAQQKAIKKASEVTSRQIEMRNKEDHSILYKVFPSAYQAAIQEFNDKNKNSLIHRCAKGERKSAYGYWWCYS